MVCRALGLETAHYLQSDPFPLNPGFARAEGTVKELVSKKGNGSRDPWYPELAGTKLSQSLDNL